MKTKVTTNKQAMKIAKRLEAQLKKATDFIEEPYIIKTDNCGTFLTTTFRSDNIWIMSAPLVKIIIKVAERFCNRYENMIWGFECSEYTSTNTGMKYPTPQLYIQLTLSKNI